MQRKNYFLKTSIKVKKMRNAMAMVMAIIVLVVIATVMSLSLALTIQTSKRTTDMYLYEQSVLVSQSAAEYAMLKISQATQPCSLSSIPNYTYNGVYNVSTTMRYISNTGTPCANNTPAGSHFATTTFVDFNGDLSSDGSIIMDITVTANPAGTTEPIRYFRRSVQKM